MLPPTTAAGGSGRVGYTDSSAILRGGQRSYLYQEIFELQLEQRKGSMQAIEFGTTRLVWYN